MIINVNGYQVDTKIVYAIRGTAFGKIKGMYVFRRDGKCKVYPNGKYWLDPKENGIKLSAIQAVEFGDYLSRQFSPVEGDIIAVSGNGNDWFAKQFNKMSADGKYICRQHIGNPNSKIAHFPFAKPLADLVEVPS